MIRAAKEADLARLGELWLDTNVKAHTFIPARYWEANLEPVKELLPQAEVYVYEDGDGIQGFIGLNRDYIAGIFVWSGAQSRGIGKELLEHAKGIKERLNLHVYQKNLRAVRFYLREGFHIQREGQDANTSEAEYEMEWQRISERNASEACKSGKTMV